MKQLRLNLIFCFVCLVLFYILPNDGVHVCNAQRNIIQCHSKDELLTIKLILPNSGIEPDFLHQKTVMSGA